MRRWNDISYMMNWRCRYHRWRWLPFRCRGRILMSEVRDGHTVAITCERSHVTVVDDA